MLYDLAAILFSNLIALILYLIIGLRYNQEFEYHGERLGFKEYILEVLLQAIERTERLTSNLLADIALPLHTFVPAEEAGIWTMMLLIGCQVQMASLCNLVSLVWFLPLHLLSKLLRYCLDDRRT